MIGGEMVGMTIKVNGDTVAVSDGETVAELLVRLGKSPKYLAVERNGELVPRAPPGEVVRGAGACVETVTLVGGGSHFGETAGRR